MLSERCVARLLLGGALLACVPWAVLILVALLAGCATPKPEIRIVREPVEVRVPVPVACVTPEQLPRLPGLAADAALAQRPDYDLVISLDQQRRLLRAHVQQTDALLAACARVPSVPPPKEPR